MPWPMQIAMQWLVMHVFLKFMQHTDHGTDSQWVTDLFDYELMHVTPILTFEFLARRAMLKFRSF